jgi:hypothetical protein
MSALLFRWLTLASSCIAAVVGCNTKNAEQENVSIGPCLQETNRRLIDNEPYLIVDAVDRDDADGGKVAAMLLRLRSSYTGNERKQLDGALRVVIADCAGSKTDVPLEQLFDMRFVDKAKQVMEGCSMYLSNGCHVCGKMIGKQCRPSCQPGGSPFDPPWEEWNAEYGRPYRAFDSKDPRPRWNPQWNP